MAIYHLNVSSVGRKTHAAGTAGAHARYITRGDAASVVEAQHMPRGGNDARSWLNAQEKTDRVNGRVITKIRMALPLELTRSENVALVREFVRDLTDGNRVPTLWAVHDKGQDRKNPHVHIIVRDRDANGDQVVKFSASPRDRRADGLEPNAVEHCRKLWEATANRHLERGGHDARIDRRTLKAQNVDRAPTIHEGVRAQALEAKGQNPATDRARAQAKVISAFGKAREIPYDQVDQGRTRAEFNRQLQAQNERRAQEAARRETERRRAERRQRLADFGSAAARTAGRAARSASGQASDLVQRGRQAVADRAERRAQMKAEAEDQVRRIEQQFSQGRDQIRQQTAKRRALTGDPAPAPLRDLVKDQPRRDQDTEENRRKSFYEKQAERLRREFEQQERDRQLGRDGPGGGRKR